MRCRSGRRCRAMGYVVPLVVLTGEEAVARVLETEPDLVLMDIQLKGGLSGIEAARRIRQRPRRARGLPHRLLRRGDPRPGAAHRALRVRAEALRREGPARDHPDVPPEAPPHARGCGRTGGGCPPLPPAWWRRWSSAIPRATSSSSTPRRKPCWARAQAEVLEKRLSERGAAHRRGKAHAPFLSRVRAAPGGKEHAARRLPPGHVRREGSCPSSSARRPCAAPRAPCSGSSTSSARPPSARSIQNLVLRELEELAGARRRPCPRGRPRSRHPLRLALPAHRLGRRGCAGLLPAGRHARGVLRAGRDRPGDPFLGLFSLLLHTFLSPHLDRGGILRARRNAAEYPRQADGPCARRGGAGAEQALFPPRRGEPVSSPSPTGCSTGARAWCAWSAPATRFPCSSPRGARCGW